MRLIDADTLADWVLCNLYDQCFDTLTGRQAANLIGKAIDGSPTVGGWVSVKDRLPKEDTIVLVARKYVEPGQKERLYVETAERIGFDWVSQTDEYKLHRQFHTQPYAWMPLPEPPEVEE